MTARAILVFFLITGAAYSAESPRGSDIFEIRKIFEQPSAETVEMELPRGVFKEVVNVSKKPVLTATAVQSATVVKDPFSGGPQIEITFNRQGQKAFADLTKTNIGQRLAILLNGNVQTAPVIRQQIPGGRILVSVNFSEDKARDFADQLNRSVNPGSGRKEG